MSLQSATEFTNTLTSNPELAATLFQSANGKTVSEAAAIASDLGKQHGFDFTADEAIEARNAYASANPLSEEELDSVAGGGDSAPYIGTMIGTVAGQLAPTGTGGVVGAGVGAGVATAVGGGSASESVAAGAVAAANNLNESKNIVQQIFSGW
ncbi:Nif11 family protein [Terriglobus albidus]|uniref:Nif11 family protein n=1 Tax=Terriglobus albidus TaxID=1592106 RepID=A0A5B9EED0_9BACT|nr:Nif11 family protein [Terriglobus albidus]QEE30402.1 Nif11 family protein [Terriglobus albidus]